MDTRHSSSVFCWKAKALWCRVASPCIRVICRWTGFFYSAVILALLPLALALGQGSAMQLPLVLIARPVVFHLLKGDVNVSC